MDESERGEAEAVTETHKRAHESGDSGCSGMSIVSEV
jgi:hypothetical protein